VAGQLVESIHLVVTGDLLFRAGEDQGGGAIDRGLRGRSYESPPLPDGDDRYPDLFPKAAFRQGFTYQRGADRGGFGDDEVVEAPQDIGAKITAEGPARQGTPEDLRKFQDPGASRQIEDIDGVGRVGGGDHGNGFRYLPDGECDVGVHLVTVRRHDHGGLFHPHLPVGFRIVDVAHGDSDPCVIEFLRPLVFVHDHHIIPFINAQLFDEGHGYLIVRCDDDVIFSPGRQFLGIALSGFRLDPRGEKELDEGEGQEDQQEDYPG